MSVFSVFKRFPCPGFLPKKMTPIKQFHTRVPIMRNGRKVARFVEPPILIWQPLLEVCSTPVTVRRVRSGRQSKWKRLRGQANN